MKAFIFDFDGVIVDSELHWDKDAYDVYKSIVPSFTREDDRNLKGRSLVEIYGILVSDFGATIGKNEYFAIVDRYAQTLYGEKAKLLPGIRELIARLDKLSIPIAIASSGERRWIDLILEREDLKKHFQHIVMATDVGIGKPDPAVYLEAAKRLGHVPDDCVAYEDSTNGLRASTSAGMFSIAIKHPWGYVQDLSLANIVVESHDELTEETLRSF